MLKLLTAFRSAPTVDSARKLVRHCNRHPMALCLATPADLDTITRASTLLEGAA